MVSAITVGVSGFNAAAERVKTSADNLANQFSTARVEGGKVVNEPYVPQQVQSISQENGGVTTKRVDKYPASVPIAKGDGTTVDMPNVDTAEELVNMQVAANDAKANLAAMRIENKMQQSLLDIFV